MRCGSHRKGDRTVRVSGHEFLRELRWHFCHETDRGESHGRMHSSVQNGDSDPSTGAAAVLAKPRWFDSAMSAATNHWQEYSIEAACLGLFMVSACSFTVLLEHPASALRHAITSSFARRMLTGIAMGLTAVALIYSPWGKQSGAHLNPSTTLTFSVWERSSLGTPCSMYVPSSSAEHWE